VSTLSSIGLGLNALIGAKKATARVIKLVKKDKVRWPLHNFTMIRTLWHKLAEREADELRSL